MSRGTDHADSRAEEYDIDVAKARKGVRLLLEATGHSPNRDELEQTWKRRVPSAFETLTSGNRESNKPTMRTFSVDNSTVVKKRGIPFYSTCEHHLLPFFGEVDVKYEARDQVVGLSKISRYVKWCSRKFTMQERLTQDIAQGLKDELNANAVHVKLSANHLCEIMRGVETESTTVTETTVGEFTE